MIEKIKKDFYYENFWEQFQSSDYFKFFGYTRHSSFKRFLDNEKYYEHIWCESWSKINTRERNTISFDRELFVKLCQLKNILVQEVEQIAVEYYSSQFKKRILNFRVRTKADIGSPLQMYNVPMGKYYTYSLYCLIISYTSSLTKGFIPTPSLTLFLMQVEHILIVGTYTSDTLSGKPCGGSSPLITIINL